MKISPIIKTSIWGVSYDYSAKGSIVIKKICAEENLSLQVHPRYPYLDGAQDVKHEFWWVKHAAPYAKILGGFNQDTNRAAVTEAIEYGTLDKLLNSYDVSGGEWFYTRPGTVHSLQSGCTVWEIQNDVDITYRLYDYNRKSRQLHVSEGMESLNFNSTSCSIVPRTVIAEQEYRVKAVDDCPLFSIKEITINGKLSLDRVSAGSWLIVASGQLRFNDELLLENDVCFVESECRGLISGQGVVLLVS
ncbi:MAG: class I mannose-6-phosphate isomerase [Clostridiales bacterium]|nr:class I mannose-6-phosphate isomerase [Clostridiales bacterium]